ncbi:MAG TPA: phosphotransferase, partial [Trueperaceae bacterium]
MLSNKLSSGPFARHADPHLLDRARTREPPESEADREVANGQAVQRRNRELVADVPPWDREEPGPPPVARGWRTLQDAAPAGHELGALRAHTILDHAGHAIASPFPATQSNTAGPLHADYPRMLWEVYRLDGPQRFLKACLRRPGVTGLETEARRLAWLADRASVPRVLAFEQDAQRDYLLMSAVPGQDAASRTHRRKLHKLVALLASGLKQLHKLPIESCPFDHTPDVEISRARV